jgi:hypothetical protein
MFEMFGILEIFVMVSAGLFCLTSVWYFTGARNYAPVTAEEAQALWQIHKREVCCTSNKWSKVKHKDAIIGFECGCGYNHSQKRPMI